MEEMGKALYSITLDADLGLVRLVVSGELSKEVGEEIITKTMTTADEHHYKILCDVRQARVNVSLADWFFMPRTLAVYKNIKARFIKTALLIMPGKQEKEYGFFESVTHNLGMNLKIFYKEPDALEWLALPIHRKK